MNVAAYVCTNLITMPYSARESVKQFLLFGHHDKNIQREVTIRAHRDPQIRHKVNPKEWFINLLQSEHKAVINSPQWLTLMGL